MTKKRLKALEKRYRLLQALKNRAYFASFKRAFGRYFVAKCDIKKQIEMIIKVSTLNLLKKDFILISSKAS
ncbi:hypothetical protein [Candidatus Lariskella endosymbiont of Hedychridium roseum]|uniref:hypothetical protein n=1 Tax=Candidatus Lariskella endosymbiont of Hedychridium roseum TaxID=3077949 RepID=UPI0030D00050